MSDTTYSTYAAGLRDLANILEGLAFPVLPEPQYPGQTIELSIMLATPADVDQAAKALGVKATHSHSGHHETSKTQGLVRVKFYHVDDATMERHHAEQAYLKTMPTPPLCDFCSEPITGVPVVNPDEASWLGTGAATYCSRDCLDAHNEARIQAAGGPS